MQNIDLEELNAAYIRTSNHNNQQKAQQSLAPFPTVFSHNDTQQRREWESVGYELIAEGRLGMLLLAGGQVHTCHVHIKVEN